MTKCPDPAAMRNAGRRCETCAAALQNGGCRVNKLPTLLAVVLLLLVPTISDAQSFPSKPITLVVPYPPGGTADQLARRLLEPMSRDLGQQVIVDNKAGAGGTIGIGSVATAPPDGYRLLVLTGGAVHAHTNKDVDIRRLTFVALVARVPQVLVVGADSPYKSMRDLMNSKKPIVIATPGEGSLAAYNALTLRGEIQPGASVVPYKGTAPALTDILGGQATAGFFALSAVIDHVRAGRLRIIGVSGVERHPDVPDALPLSQAGSGNTYLDDWVAVVGPPDMPRDVAARLAAAVNKARGSIGFEGFKSLGMIEDRRDASGYGTSVNQSLIHSVGGGGGTTCNAGQCYCKAKRTCQEAPCTSGC